MNKIINKENKKILTLDVRAGIFFKFLKNQVVSIVRYSGHFLD